MNSLELVYAFILASLMGLGLAIGFYTDASKSVVTRYALQTPQLGAAFALWSLVYSYLHSEPSNVTYSNLALVLTILPMYWLIANFSRKERRERDQANKNTVSKEKTKLTYSELMGEIKPTIREVKKPNLTIVEQVPAVKETPMVKKVLEDFKVEEKVKRKKPKEPLKKRTQLAKAARSKRG